MPARIAPFLIVLAICSGCSTAGKSTARPALHTDLSAIEAIGGTAVRNGASGAPIAGVTVTGTLTNTDARAMRCTTSAFLLSAGTENPVTPSSAWCALPSIAPNQSTAFSATFATTARTHLQLRFEHPSGTYELHQIVLSLQ
jgi:hypothetical protein